MKLLLVSALAVAATSVSALSLSGFGGQQQQPLTIQDLTPVPGKSPVNYCSDHSKDLIDVEYLNLKPEQPVRGGNLTIEAKGTVKERIEEGAYVHLEVKYGFIKLINSQVDFCEQLKQVDEKCPLEKGDMTILKEVEIPKEVPPGKFTVTANVFTKEDVLITCLQAMVVFPAKS